MAIQNRLTRKRDERVNRYKTPERKQETVTRVDIAPVDQGGVRSTDFVGGGSITVTGKNVWTSSGGGGSGGSSSTPVQVLSSTLTPQQQTEFLQSRGQVAVPIASTSATQVQQKTVSSPTASTFNKPVKDDKTFTQKLASVGKAYTSPDIYRKTGRSIFGLDNTTPLASTPGTFLAPFGVFFTGTKGDKVVSDIPYRGTEMDFGQTPSGYGSTTGYDKIDRDIILNPDLGKPSEQIVYEADVKFQKDIAKDITPSYQGRIDAGEDYDSVTKDFEKDFKERYESGWSKTVGGGTKNVLIQKSDILKDISKANERSFDLPKTLSTASLIGASFVAPVTAGAFVFGSGISSGYEGISEKNYLKAGVGFGFATLGAGYSIRAQNLAIDKQMLSDLGSRQDLIVGVGKYKSSSSLMKVDTLRGRPDASFRTSQLLPVFRSGSRSFVTGGRGVSTLKYFSEASNKWVIDVQTFKTGASLSKAGNLFSFKGGVGSPILGDTSSGKGFVMKYDDTLREFKFFGVSEKTGQEGIYQVGVAKSKTAFVNILKGDIKIRGTPTGAGLVKVTPFKDTSSGTVITFTRTGSSSGGSGNNQIQNLVSGFTPRKVIAGQTALATASEQISLPTVKTFSEGLTTLTTASQVQLPKTTTTQRLNVLQTQIPSLNQKTETSLVSGTISTQIPRPSTRTDFFQGVTPLQTPKLDNLQKQIPKMETPTFTPIPPFTPTPQTPYKVPPIGFPKFGLDLGGMSGLGKLKATRTYSYIPSFGALVFGIRGKGSKPVATKRFTGLETRPIYKGSIFKSLTPKTKKKRKKSK